MLAAALDELGQLEPVHARHPDVEHDRGEVVLQQREQRLVGRLRADQPAAAGVQDGLQRVQVPAWSSTSSTFTQLGHRFSCAAF